MKSDDQFLFTAPVMIPGKPDCDYQRGETPFTVDEIRFFKESFNDYQIIDKNHQVFKDIGSAKAIGDPVDSFMLHENTTFELADGSYETYPQGTWMLTTNVTDPLSQQEIEDGILTGYSPSVNREDIGQLIKKYMATKASNGQLIHDIPNPNTITVSIVKKPCQSGSKQCKLKNEGESMSEDTKTLSRIREILGGGEPAATKSDFDALAEELKEELKEENAAAMKSLGDEMSTMISDTIDAKLSEIGALKANTKNEEDEEDEEEEDESNSQSEEDEEDDDKKKKSKKSKNGGSKQGSVHGATKEDVYDPELDTYAVLGRNPNGTRKRE